MELRRVERPNQVQFISKQYSDLVYDFTLSEIGVKDFDDDGLPAKYRLRFKDHLCTLDKERDKKLIEAAMTWFEAQFEKDTRGRIKKDADGRPIPKSRPVPFEPFDQFENSIAKTPVRYDVPGLGVVELAPEEISKLVNKSVKAEAPKKKKGETVKGTRKTLTKVNKAGDSTRRKEKSK